MKTDWANKDWLKKNEPVINAANIITFLIILATTVYLVNWFIEELAK